MIDWGPHLNLLIQGEDGPRLQEAIKTVFPPEPTAISPYAFKAVANSNKALSSFIKPNFFAERGTKIKKQTRVAKLPLTGGDLKELLAFLGGYPVGTRLLLNGVDPSGKVLGSSNEK